MPFVTANEKIGAFSRRMLGEIMTDARSETAPPPLTSLHDWQVGVLPDGNSEVRIILTDPAEARAWVEWMFARMENLADEL